jgi:outer membrane protein
MRPVAIMILYTLCSLVAGAQEGKGLKIGYVDLDQVTQKAHVIRKVVDNVEGDLKKKQDDVDAKLQHYQTLRDTLAKQEAILTEEQRETRRKELRNLKNEIDDLQYQVNKELRRSEREMIDPAVEKIMKTITAVGKEKGYDLILRSEVVLYGKETHDITGDVVDKLNAESSESKPEGAEKKPEATPEKKEEGAAKQDSTNF